MTKELEPCPFCGGEAMLCENIDYSYVYCMRCGCQTNEASYILDAIEAWNTRYKRTCKSDYCRETDEWQCLSCGGTLQNCAMFDPDVDGFVGSPKFCPNCGAEVVDD